MSSIVKKEWYWSVATINGGEYISSVDINYWESNHEEINSITTDEYGKANCIVSEAIYTIDNETDISEDMRTPHVISILKYGLDFMSLDSYFSSSKTDTFYLSNNENISEQDKSVVSSYSGISIDNDSKEIVLTEDHTIEELYDYTQSYFVDIPIKNSPTGIFKTSDGVNFILIYDLIIDGCVLSGGGRYIDMSNNEYIRLNDASSDVKIKDINGVSLVFKFTIEPSIDNYEYRIYKVNAKGSLDGAEELQGLEDAVEDSYIYVYNYNDEDVIIALQILPHHNDYVESTDYYVLSNENQSVSVILQKDINN